MPCRKRSSYGYFDDPITAVALYRVDIHRQATLDGFVEVGEQFFEALSLGNAAGQGGDFGPESTFFRFMDDNFDLHSYSP